VLPATFNILSQDELKCEFFRNLVLHLNFNFLRRYIFIHVGLKKFWPAGNTGDEQEKGRQHLLLGPHPSPVCIHRVAELCRGAFYTRSNLHTQLVFESVLRIRIRTFLVGSGSGRLGPDPDPGLNK
jgi:hypothetical protein